MYDNASVITSPIDLERYAMESTSGARKCGRHPEQSATIRCARCGAAICRECIQEFGYFCGAECLEESRASVSPQDLERREREDQELRKFSGHSRRIAGIAVAVLTVLVAWWLWSAIVGAPGKPAWTWQPKGLENPEIVGVNGKSLLVLSGRRLVIVNAANGREQDSIELPVSPDGGFHQTACRDGRLSLAGAMNALSIDLDKKNVRHLSFAERCADAAISQDGRVVCALFHENYDYIAGATETPSRVICHTFGGTDPVWELGCDEGGARFTRVMAVGDFVAVLQEAGTALTRRGACTVSIHDLASGARKWRLAFGQPLAWGPASEDGFLAVQAGNTFVVVDLQGNQKWSATVSGTDVPAHLIADSRVYLRQENGEECRDLATGRTLWRSPAVFDGEFLVRDRKRLIASGFAPKAESTGTPGGLPGGNDSTEILTDLSSGTAALLQGFLSRPVVTALDPDTGKDLWRRDNISGRLYGTPAQLVAVSGAGSVNLLQMFAGGGGGTTIRQLSAKTGETRYTRFLDFPFAPYGVVAGRLAGVSYDLDGRTAVMGLRLK